MISTDRSIFDPDAAVRSRLLEQASLVSELHVIVFTPKGSTFTKLHLSKHLTVYPTTSANKFAYLPDAYALGKNILSRSEEKKRFLITTQDPFETGVIGYLLSRKFKIPFHVQLHTDPFNHEWKKEHLLNRIRFILALFLLRKADAVRVVSARVFARVYALGIETSRITKVPIYVDVEHFTKTKPSFDLHHSYGEYSHIVLSMGRLEPEKNFDKLIRAFRRVHQTFPDTLLIIVGSGKERERLTALIRSFELDKYVKILPWARDVVSYYKTCDVYVQPSRYEGWGLSIIEALASGAPVAMTDVGCAGEVVRDGETGLVIPSFEEGAIAGTINRLLSDAVLRKELGIAGKKEVKKLATKAETLMLYKASWEQALLHGHKQ